MTVEKQTETWYVYLIITECNCLYTGVSTDVARRFQEHLDCYLGKSSKGAKYFRAHKPVEVVYCEALDSRSSALKREYAIKKSPKNKKERLVVEFGSVEK